jgi:drug/metabolite transporter (DMT)-like permease
MTKVELGTILDGLSKEADPTGIFVYVIVTACLLVSFSVLAGALNNGIISASVFLFFIFVNFLALGLAIFLLYKMIKSGKGLSPTGALGALKKKEEFTTGQLFGKKKYIHMCIVSLALIGTSLAFED